MGGKVVQLVRGRDKAWESDDLEAILDQFAPFPLIHAIDLDAALGQGDNSGLIEAISSRRRVRVGGGIRTVEQARRLVETGAEQVIVGSAAFDGPNVYQEFLGELADQIGKERMVLAIDSKGGYVSVKGWQESAGLTPRDAVRQSAGLVETFLCTYVDQEGTMAGTDIQLFVDLKHEITGTLVAAGGIGSLEEVETLVRHGIEVALGMSVYTGRLSLDDVARLVTEADS